MSSSSKIQEPAFQGVGQKQGTEIWRIENFQPVPLPKSDYGKFYMGDSYIVLHTTHGKTGTHSYDIHFWIGKDTSQDESGTAAIKTVELDAMLGGRAVQHRELQGHESDKFLSYFKPCIVPIEGGVASGFKTPEQEVFETRLYICKGKRVVKLKQVPFARSSLNHDDVFILDTEKKIYQFNGANSNIQERAKALEVIQFLKETYHDGVCGVAIVDDGKLDTESDSGEFWVLFGGFAPIGKKVVHDDDVIPETTPAKLYSITNGAVELVQGELSKKLLENNKCYLLDCGSEVFVWVGRATQVEDRKAAIKVVEEFITSSNRPKTTRITRLTQGHETNSFKSNFDSWPAASAAPGGEERVGKVAAMLKQQKLAAKGAAKTGPVHEEVPLLEGGGKMEVWYVDGGAKMPLPKEDIGKFHSGDCYVVLYSYHSGDRREDHFLCSWIGKNSIEEDQETAAKLANTMFNSHKGRPVQGRVFEGKEPPQFVALFQPMVVLKGGLSTGYKKSIADKGLKDESYTADCVALFHISGTEKHNTKALQVDAVAKSLNSHECFLLQSGSSTIFTWYGTQSTHEQQELAAKVAEILKPGVTRKHCKEGTETSAFWSALGGKDSYTTTEKESNETIRDPHLFTFSLNKGKFQVEEVYNFSQGDLLTEDILILDTHAEVFVWVGQCVDTKEKQSALNFGQQYIDMAVSLEGLSPKVTLYKVTEGNEPCFFTVFFSWDSHRATVQGNSFQQKMALLFGVGSSDGKGSAPKPSGPSQGSQRAAAVAALSGVLTAEKKDGSPRKSASNTPLVTSPHSDVADPSESHDWGDSANQGLAQDECTYTYDQLKSKSENPATGIDLKRREAYLSDEEFETVFGMPKEAFYKMPKWKQDKHKKDVDLF